MQLRSRKLQSSVAHQILRKRLYTEGFDWDRVTYPGILEPLVTRECWQRAQQLLDARAENRTRKVKHEFAYTAMVHCGRCGCLLVGELKKGRYVYYHCTGNRGKCPEPYIRQEVLAGQFADLLGDLVIPPAILEWLGDAVFSSDRTEAAARRRECGNSWTRYEQIEGRSETMYMDRLDGRITEKFFDQQTDRLLQTVVEKAFSKDGMVILLDMTLLGASSQEI